MPRRKRSYLPGCAFHITARTHSGEFWFEGLQPEIIEIIARALKQTDALLLAWAIMTNHLHLVVLQGAAPLGRLMHPIGQRIAYAVHRHWKRKGYVLGYRYFETACRDEAHLRNAIMYTHRNPVEAGLCKEAAEYEWSSARAYASNDVGPMPALQPALKLFASGLPDRTLQQDYSDLKTLSPVLVAIRSTVMERAIRADHRTIDIANFLNASDSTISRLRTRMALAAPA
jgi:REP-associated tyrosine transposase